MSEMVERVAKAIRDERMGASAAKLWQDYIPAARIAIAAMRLPTEEMLRAGRGPYPDRDPADIWPDMIDAALLS